jgi:hypothetical protein
MPSTHVVLTAALVATALGVAVMLAGYWGWPQESVRLMRTGPFVLWTFLIASQLVLWTLVLGPVVRVVRSRSHALARAWPEVFLSSVIFIVCLVIVSLLGRRLLPQPDYIPHASWRMVFVVMVGGLVGMVTGWGLWLTRNAAVDLTQSDSTLEQRCASFHAYRGDVERLLGILAAIIALAVLATAAQRRVVMSFATNLKGDEIRRYADYLPFAYPAEFVVLYGLIFTVLIALFSLPTLITLQTVGSDLLNEGEPFTQERADLAARYQLEVSPGQVLRTTLAILAPLIGSLAGLLPGIT